MIKLRHVFKKQLPSTINKLFIGRCGGETESVHRWVKTIKTMPTIVYVEYDSTPIENEDDLKLFLNVLYEYCYLLCPDDFNNNNLYPLITCLLMYERRGIINFDDPFYGDYIYKFGMTKPSRIGYLLPEYGEDKYFYKKMRQLFVEKQKVITICSDNNPKKMCELINMLNTTHIHLNLVSHCQQTCIIFCQEFLKGVKIATLTKTLTAFKLFLEYEAHIADFGVNSKNMAKYCVKVGRLDLDLNKFNREGQAILKKALLQGIM